MVSDLWIAGRHGKTPTPRHHVWRGTRTLYLKTLSTNYLSGDYMGFQTY